MFLIVPITIACVSLVIILVIVYRKMPYLRKLTPESHVVGDTILHDFAPEIMDKVSSVPWRRALHNMLVEFEKVLRRGRLLMSSLDRASEGVIRRVRTVHQANARQQDAIVARRQEVIAKQAEEPDDLDLEDPQQLQEEEQRLIVAIAQHPKDVELYSRLARIYMRLENYEDKVEALKAALKLAPNDQTLVKRLERARNRLNL